MQKNIPFRCKHILLILISGLIVFLFIAQFYHCPILTYLGFPCPGCGITRASMALLRLDFSAAAHYNAAIFFLVPLAGIELLSYLFNGWKSKRFFFVLGLCCISLFFFWILKIF